MDKSFPVITGPQTDLDAVAINAGIGGGGDFTDTSPREEIQLKTLNIISSVHLTKRILPMMKAKD